MIAGACEQCSSASRPKFGVPGSIVIAIWGLETDFRRADRRHKQPACVRALANPSPMTAAAARLFPGRAPGSPPDHRPRRFCRPCPPPRWRGRLGGAKLGQGAVPCRRIISIRGRFRRAKTAGAISFAASQIRSPPSPTCSRASAGSRRGGGYREGLGEFFRAGGL